MYEELGIDKESYENLLNKVSLSDIYNFIKRYNFGQVSLYYYVDENGSLDNGGDSEIAIAKAIYDNLTPAEKLNLLSYIDE